MRRLLVLAATVAALLLGASRALACGTSAGYSYAGVAAPAKAFGISASVTPMGGFDVMAGHGAGWDGGTNGACNGFLYRFDRVAIAAAPGGGWRPLAGALDITSNGTRIQRDNGKGSFVAAEGDDAFRLLASARG